MYQQQAGYSQRPLRNEIRQPLRSSPQRFCLPGTKSFHLYNTMLFMFIGTQIALYLIQGIQSPCSQLSTIFYGFMAAQIFALFAPIIVVISLIAKKWFVFAQIFTVLTILGKIGVIITTYVATQNHVGYCYVKSDIKLGISVANGAQALCLFVLILFIRHLKKLNEIKEIQEFMDSSRAKGYF